MSALSNHTEQQSQGLLSYATSAFDSVKNVTVQGVSVVTGSATHALSKVGEKIPQALVVADKTLDLIPLGSTANNLIDLGLKHLVIKDRDPESSEYKVYIEHLQKKNTSECLAYSVPLAGNVVKLGVLIYNAFKSSKEPQEELEPVFPPSPFDESEGVSTIGLRLRDEEKKKYPDYEESTTFIGSEAYREFTLGRI